MQFPEIQTVAVKSHVNDGRGAQFVGFCSVP